jgi:kinetochore protein Mis13/DSN1
MLTVSTAYDEEDDGFVFTRASKKTKVAPTEPEPAPAPEPAPKKTNKRKARDEEPVATVKKAKGRKMSFSTPKADSDTLNVPKKRKGARSSTGKAQNGETSTNQSTLENTDYDSIDMIGAPGADEKNKSRPEVEVSKNSMVISLPFSDTPIINRNKELRKKGGGTRRSSLGLRGRRASSLIDNGHSAIPHREVEEAEFYKHIEAEGLTEPRRMKQLMMWTGERMLGEKPSHGDPDSAAALAGEHIDSRSQVLTDNLQHE